MSNPKILDIIRSFSEKERDDFGLFLNSPFFMREANVEVLSRLYAILVEDGSQADIPERPAIHAILFPEKAYSEARLEKVFAKLGGLVEQFLVTNYYLRTENTQQRSLDLVSVLREKRLIPLYEKKLQKIQKDTKDNPVQSTEFYKFKYLIAREEHEWRSIFNVLKGDLAILDTIHNLDLFYLLERTELSNRLLLQQKVAVLPQTASINLNVFDPASAKVYESESPLLHIRKQIQDSFLETEPSKQALEVLMDLIFEHEESFPAESIQELFAYLRNLCTLLINRGTIDTDKLGLYGLLHKIQQDNLDRGYFYHGGKLGAYALMSITKAALEVNNIEWAKQFLASHRYKILGVDEMEEHYNFCLALCLFQERKFDESLQKISFIANFPYLLIHARRLELQAYFELKSDLILFKIDAFRKYLERTAQKSLSIQGREPSINFVNLLLQIVLSKPTDPKRSARLIKRIEEKKNLAEQLWLLEKARELA